MKRPTQATRERLRAEYHNLPDTTNKLTWCIEQGRGVGMSYGAFVNWLGI